MSNLISKIKEGSTTPPKEFTEDTLLSSMENASKKENIEKEFCGIGTSATRAGIIEKLIKVQLIERTGKGKVKSVIPTKKGVALVSVLPDVLKSPITTALWEQKLKDVENGTLSADIFSADINTMIKDLVDGFEVVKNSAELFPSDAKVVGTCPRCGKNVIESKKAFSCEDRNCKFALWKENKLFTNMKKSITEKIAKDLLNAGKTELTNCHSPKTGKKYNCTLLLDDTGDGYVNFKMEFPKRG